MHTLEPQGETVVRAGGWLESSNSSSGQRQEMSADTESSSLVLTVQTAKVLSLLLYEYILLR